MVVGAHPICRGPTGFWHGEFVAVAATNSQGVSSDWSVSFGGCCGSIACRNCRRPVAIVGRPRRVVVDGSIAPAASPSKDLGAVAQPYSGKHLATFLARTRDCKAARHAACNRGIGGKKRLGMGPVAGMVLGMGWCLTGDRFFLPSAYPGGYRSSSASAASTPKEAQPESAANSSKWGRAAARPWVTSR